MIRLLIVADIRLYREGLAQVLSRDRRLAVVGTAADLQGALDQVRQLAPDVVLLDMAMPESLGTATGIAAAAPDVQIVALGVSEVEDRWLACAEAGVAGYVSREASVADLVEGLERVARGEFVCSPRTAATLLRRVAALASRARPTPPFQRLTGREREILALLEQGLSNKDIARRLGIEVATVKNHVHNLLDKLHVRRRSQAAAQLRTYASSVRRI